MTTDAQRFAYGEGRQNLNKLMEEAGVRRPFLLCGKPFGCQPCAEWEIARAPRFDDIAPNPDIADVRRAIESGIAKVNIATEFLDGYIKSTLKVFGDLNGAFVPPDKLADPIIDACAAHVRRLIAFFAGR